MSVQTICGHIQAAEVALHNAMLEYKKTPKRYKYLEVTELNQQIDDLYTRLRVLGMNARDVHRKVLIREGKTPRF